jgi:hypothetical protein
MQYLMCGILLVVYYQAMISPVWNLVALLVTEQALPGYIPGTPITFRLGAAALSTLLAAPIIVRGLQRWSPGLRRVLLPTLAFMVTTTVVNSYFSEPDYVFKYLRLQSVHLVVLVLAACVINDRRDLKIAAGVGLSIAVVSALFAIAQHFTTSPIAYPAAIPEDLVRYGGRSVGLARSPVSLANDMMLALPLALGLMITAPWRTGTLHLVLGSAIMMITVGVYLSFTRSALLGIAAALAVMAVFTRGWSRAAVVGALVMAPILFVLLQDTGLIGNRLYKSVEDDGSAASHLATIQVGLELAMDNWFTGIGHESFQESSTAYADAVSGDIARLGVRGRLGEAQAHNDFLNVWFSWGIIALIAYLGVFVGVLFNCLVAANCRDWLIRGLAIGCAAGLSAYVIGSATHNYLDAGVVLWLYAGLSATLVALAKSAAVAADPRHRVHLLRGARRMRTQPATS